MGDIGVYIEYVDHLSDRELYAELRDYCDKPNMVFPGNKSFGLHWSPLGSWGEEDTQVWLQYYATDQERIKHSIDYPKAPMPPKKPLVSPRPWLPKQDFGFGAEEEEEEEE